MRIRLLAMLSVVSFGLFGAYNSLAGPSNGNGIDAAVAAGAVTVNVAARKADPEFMKECVRRERKRVQSGLIKHCVEWKKVPRPKR